jgi:hypothetical protein
MMGNSREIDFAALIPGLAEWNNGRGISIEGWTQCSGSFELAIGYSRLFWPAFVEHDGCVLLAGFSVESYRGFMDQCGGDRRRVEAVLNHRHVFDHFSHADGSATAQQIVYLGRILKDMWEAKLARDFPSRRFVVSFPEGPYDDIVDYEVTFWQASPGE